MAADSQPQPQQQPHGILDQSLGDILQHNPKAQQLIMKSMGISQDKFNEMLNSAQKNNLMHMKVRDLFKNGIVQQAVQQQGKQQQSVQVQLTPEQMQQLQNGQLSMQDIQAIQQQQNVSPVAQQSQTNTVINQTSTTEKPPTSFMDKVKLWFS